MSAAIDMDELKEMLADIHLPFTEEAEFYCFDDGSERNWGCASYDDCMGHIVPMRRCAECGHDYEDDRIMFRPWPCRTAELAGLGDVA